MSKFAKVGVVVVLVVAIGAMIGMRIAALSPQSADEGNEGRQAAAKPAALPKMVDLGAKKCIPCQKMAPILEELTKEYAGKFDIEFIDVSIRANRRKATQYKIRLIPTQVFLDAEGKELARHEGFLGKADILAKWKELGYDFSGLPKPGRVVKQSPSDSAVVQ